MCVCVHVHVCWCLRRPEEGFASPGAGVTGCREPPHVGARMNSGPLEKQVLLNR